MSPAVRLSAWVLALLATAVQAEPAVERITWLSGDTLAQREGGRIERPSDRMINWLSERLPAIAAEAKIAAASSQAEALAFLDRPERAALLSDPRLLERWAALPR